MQDQVLTLQLPKHLSFKEVEIGSTYIVFIAKNGVLTANEVVRIEAPPTSFGLHVASLTHPGVKTPMRRTNHVYGEFMQNYMLIEVIPDTNRV